MMLDYYEGSPTNKNPLGVKGAGEASWEWLAGAEPQGHADQREALEGIVGHWPKRTY